MPRGVEAIIKPALLVWARQSAGLTVEEAAKKARVTPERIESWERGDTRPTIHQLRLLGRAYKRPLAIFYLPEPPKDFQAMHDFRRFPGRVAGVQSPQLRFEIRRACSRREIALELYEELEDTPPSFTVTASLSDNPEILANKIRNLLAISYKDQISWRDEYQAFNSWRSALEAVGILVFQVTSVKLVEMRGFSISDTPFPVVAVNIKDFSLARIFTMLHEVGHLMLRKSGLCDLEEQSDIPPEEQEVEVFCNWFAGATLVPKEHLLQEDLVLKKGLRSEWSDEEIRSLARRYWVSREVLLRRLLICERTTEEFYQKKREQFLREYESSKKVETEGFAPPYRVAISSAGPLFVRLVLNSYYQERITASDLSEYLGVRLKHLEKVEKAVTSESAKSEIVR